MNKYSVAIIGCGSIGANKPDRFDSPETENVLTHAHACYNNKQIDKIIFVDTDYKRQITAVNKWKLKAGEIGSYNQICIYRDIEPMIKEQDPDIFIVSTPTRTHHQILSKISYHNPKIVIAEKPFCSNYKEAYEINSLYKAKNIPLIVDYIRRFDPNMQSLKYMIKRGDFGKIQNVRILYTRGLMHEGCHALDLMNFLFDGIWGYNIFKLNEVLYDYSKSDPTYSIKLKTELCNNIIFQPCDGREFSIFEIDIVGTKKRVTLLDHGLRMLWQDRVPEPNYGDYDTIDSTGTFEKTCLNIALEYLLKNAIAHIEDNNIPLLCTGDNALKVHRIYERLIGG
jgi:predicted dehydrogenase